MPFGFPNSPKTLVLRALLLGVVAVLYRYWLADAVAATMELPDLFAVFLVLAAIHLALAAYVGLKKAN